MSRIYAKGEQHCNWKGGFSDCKKCGKKLTVRKSKTGLCHNCFMEQAVGGKGLHWKGGTKNNNGYTMILCPNHPNCDQQGYVREHHLIIEKKLKRYLLKGEIVHHLNGIKNDNRIENLKLLTKIEHDLIILKSSKAYHYPKGNIPWNKGKPMSEEVKNKISISKRRKNV